jgi:MFS family permease
MTSPGESHPKTYEQQYAALAASNYLLVFAAGCYSTFLGSYFSSRGVRGSDVGLIGAAGSAALIGGGLVWGWISDWTGRRRSLIFFGAA